jgi:putative phosphoribosyl transferase
MMRGSVFSSREEAGRELAALLQHEKFERPLILALPRGGVPVGLEVAKSLQAPLDLLMVRKIGVPDQPELAAAAIVDGENHDIVYNHDVMSMMHLKPEDLQPTISRELSEIARRRSIYLRDRPPIPVAGRTVIVVDDGIATGTTLMVAIKTLKARQPKEIVVATPVAPAETISALQDLLGRVFCIAQPEPFIAIGLHYLDFHPLSDNEVIEALALAPKEEPAAPRTEPRQGLRRKTH